MIKKFIKNFRPFIKYCIVGTIGTLIDVGTLFVLVEYFEFPVILATVFSFILAVSNNFIFNQKWTFRSPSKNYRKMFIKFFIVGLVGLGLTVVCMYFFVHILDIWYILAKIFTSGIVLFWNFLGNKLWTFKFYPKYLEIPDHYDFQFSIVIPAYNEAERLGNTLSIIHEYVHSHRLSAEIIVVSDGSRDNTVELVKEYQKTIHHLELVEYSKNQGKGFAVKMGVKNSKGEYILFADADNSTPIEELEHLYQGLLQEKVDIAIGSRYLPKSNIKIRQPRYRIVLGRLGNFFIRTFLVDDIRDTQCGFKLFKHRVAREIFYLQRVKRFGFDMEALVIAHSLGYRVIEVPVSWYHAPGSRIRPLKDAFRTLIDLFYIKLNLWSGRYAAEQ